VINQFINRLCFRIFGLNIIKLCFLLHLIVFFSSCEEPINYLIDPKDLQTEYVIIIVVDGVRYSESWGDPFKTNIPSFTNTISQEGVVFTNFYNLGITKTYSGHAALLTGYYEDLNNVGENSPTYPNIFQLFNAKYSSDSLETLIISSKDKLASLSNCRKEAWKDKYLPDTNCGNDGLGVGSGYRDDSITFSQTINILQEFHPKLLMISFKEPDTRAHLDDWTGYLSSIKTSDRYIAELWEFINNDKFYAGKTSFFILNDHGRHLDNVKDGYISHGDDCLGCQHIFLFASGPDFIKNLEFDKDYHMTQLFSTICILLEMEPPFPFYEPIKELFKDE